MRVPDGEIKLMENSEELFLFLASIIWVVWCQTAAWFIFLAEYFQFNYFCKLKFFFVFVRDELTIKAMFLTHIYAFFIS